MTKMPWDKFMKKKIFWKTFCSLQNFLKCLINNVVGFLEVLMFINAKQNQEPDLCVLIMSHMCFRVNSLGACDRSTQAIFYKSFDHFSL